VRSIDAAAVAARFGLGDDGELEGPVARGELGQVWRLTTARGTWAVKQPFEAPARDEVDADARYQDAVAAAGVPMPRVLRTVDGDVIVPIDGITVRVYTWVDLLAPDRTLAAARVGQAVASIHRVRHHGTSGVHPWYTDPVGAPAWDALVADARFAGAPFAEQLAAARDELVALEAWIVPSEQLQTCHRDLFADNVLATPTGDLCIIDWENSGLADPTQELAMVLFEFAVDDVARAAPLVDAYAAAGGPGRVTRPEHFSMIIAVQGHLTELAARRWLDPAHAVERARNDARVRECLDEPLSRRSVLALVDAVAG
jgi:Ser/Thr protein kinase RdoA (MazF antagonist)